ncbi:MAG TPA: GNAT family N-acetyltransferase [Humibacter sp.]|nr:GNAT family N-acetyltransferase [Humibacter sp.]
MAIEYRHEADRQRYTVLKDGERVGVAEYRLGDGVIAFTHTEIDEDKRQRGMASGLVQYALDDVRDTTELRVVAECPYVKHWLGEHPDYQELQSR